MGKEMRRGRRVGGVSCRSVRVVGFAFDFVVAVPFGDDGINIHGSHEVSF